MPKSSTKQKIIIQATVEMSIDTEGLTPAQIRSARRQVVSWSKEVIRSEVSHAPFYLKFNGETVEHCASAAKATFQDLSPAP